MLERFPKRRRVTEAGEQLSGQSIELELAFEEDSVEVENDPVEFDHEVLEQGRSDPDSSCSEHYGRLKISRHSNA